MPPSRRHSNVEPGSLAVKEKIADVAFVGFAGPDAMLVCGAVLSMVTVRFAESVALPAASRTRARTWYTPSAGCELQTTR